MKQAFGEHGPLTDAAIIPSEQQATMALFWGGIGVFRNPTGHRRVLFEEPVFAAEAIVLADLLHRLLDEAEARIAGQTP